MLMPVTYNTAWAGPLAAEIAHHAEMRMANEIDRGLGEPARKVNPQMSELRTLRTPPI
jgi:hypothetical protein